MRQWKNKEKKRRHLPTRKRRMRGAVAAEQEEVEGSEERWRRRDRWRKTSCRRIKRGRHGPRAGTRVAAA